jgi:acyl dehydratase
VRSVYPGDALSASAWIEGEADEAGLWTGRLEVRNQDDVVVTAGSCLVDRLPGQ